MDSGSDNDDAYSRENSSVEDVETDENGSIQEDEALSGGKTDTGKKGRFRKEAEEYRERLSRRGVIYISRIPPYMKPNKAKNMFQQYGEVTRIYLSEEDNLQRIKRKEHGGNGAKQFTEGWVEFADKKVAKNVAESLNNTLIGGKKGSFYHDDIWNLKYLKGFKWDYLTEKMAYEKRVKEMKLRAAMLEAKRNNAEIVEQFEKNRVQQHIAERKKRKADPSVTGAGDNDSSGSRSELKRKFRQKKVIANSYGERQHKAKPALLAKVFSSKH